ncbi:MAG: DinB family protein [Anaerolineales bacterium]
MQEWQELLEEYQKGPERLTELIQKLPENSLDLSAENDSWTIRQIIHHIVDGDDIWNGFIKQALGGQGGEYISLRWYWKVPQDEWVEHWAYSQRELEPSLALYRANRGSMVSLLSAVPDGWQRTLEITWPGGETQTLSVRDVVQMHVDHLQGHSDDIQSILNTLAD